nr:phage virion morphogenesis protein [Kineococcus vitellinus]
MKPSTLASKRRVRGQLRILQEKQDLRKSLTNKRSSDGILRVEDAGKTIFMGTKDPKARFHQEGTRRMAQRKVVDLTRRQQQSMLRTVQRHVVESYPNE